jgi:2-deoxy-D-gluconate 3-dehydrogenase
MSIMNQFGLDGKRALVTGCRSGIGKAMALGLAEAGADIVGVSRTMEETGSEIEREVTAVGRKYRGYRCDFSDRRALYEFIAKVKADFPIIDILVCNAGTSMFAEAENFPDEYWDQIMEVNLHSQFIISREIGRDMLARGKGKIIFIGSILMFLASTKSPAYAASKGGVGQLTRTLANVWGNRGVNVNCIAPGWVGTEMTKDLTDDPELMKATLARIPANRIGDPQDFKGPVVFLASDASDWVHGSILLVDGGQLAR